MPLVSIAVATYNGIKFLTQQLDTLINQTYQHLEIVVSDDGSSDGTIEILESYEKRYPNFSFYKNAAPHGTKRNFENALKHCKGTYMAFSDQDDVWMLDKIEKLINGIGDFALIYHDSLFVDEKGNSLNRTFTTKLNMYQGYDSRAFLFCNTVSGHALLFHRKLLESALPFPEARLHDWWLAFRACDNGGVKYLDEVLVHYRQHQNSVTDFLMLKNDEIDIAKEEKEELEWLELCSLTEGRHEKFIKKLFHYFKNRNNHVWNWGMFFLSLTSMKTLFFYRKKNRLSTFFYIMRRSWGDETKQKARTILKKS